MATPFLISVEPDIVSSNSPIGLSLKQISYFGRVLLKASNLEEASIFLRLALGILDIYIDATAIGSTRDVVDVLDAGAMKAFVTLEQLKPLSMEKMVPSSRFVVSVSSADEVSQLRSWVAESSERNGVGVHYAASPAIDAAISKLQDDSVVQTVYRSYTAALTQSALLLNEQERVVSIMPSKSLSLGQDDISPAKLLIACAIPDQNTGLYATVVTDQRGVSLGLVWSSEESISEALKTGTGVYQSRKRGLWYKGQSSGDIQELVRIGFDCDNDCLLFVVKQRGKGLLRLTTIIFYRCC
jgi:phosphoribosyl-ATP pyrophosphohydrolase/phosphoribosyl-AMP cyclohydrolase/histidinol dehydrogenase